MKNAIFLLPASNRAAIYSPETVSEIGKLVSVTDCSDRGRDLPALAPILADTHIILSGWGMMTLDEDFLAAAPKLEAVLYGAGSVRPFVTDAFWQRDLLLTSAWGANAVPVVEHTVAAVIFGLKKAFLSNQLTRERRTFVQADDIKGVYGAAIGIIGAGMVGAGVLEKLKSYDVRTFCFDPYLTKDRAAALGTTLIDLDEMFRTCDVVSVHAANIPATAGLITGDHLRSMKPGAVFINTARGRIVKEAEMIEVLKEARIFAFIDVTDPEPPNADSPLFDLPNVFLTPHQAGPRGDEIHRQGEFVLEELRRFLAGRPPRYPVTEDMMEWMG
jgi:phosphoglycerate dehydrogenase-like enzyme